MSTFTALRFLLTCSFPLVCGRSTCWGCQGQVINHLCRNTRYIIISLRKLIYKLYKYVSWTLNYISNLFYTTRVFYWLTWCNIYVYWAKLTTFQSIVLWHAEFEVFAGNYICPPFCVTSHNSRGFNIVKW